MTNAANTSAGLVLLASEQLWPNLHSLVHWCKHHAAKDRPLVSHVFVYHTDEVQKSEKPAQSLERFAQGLGVRVSLSGRGGMMPEDVASQVRAWQNATPLDHWILNATGGTKLMTAGLFGFAGAPGVEVVYRELTGDWFSLAGAAGEGLTSHPLAIPPTEMDAIPVDDLIAATWQDDDWAVEFGDMVAPLEAPLDEVTRVWAQTSDWREVFRSLGLKAPQMKAGFLFERFLAAVVHELGVSNARCNVRRRSRRGADAQEIDLVANHRGKLRIIDCKLRSQADEDNSEVEPMATQIRQAEQTRRSLGGLNASILLVRPNRELTETERLLAKSCGVDILDRKEAVALFSGLARFLDVPALSSILQTAEETLRASARPGVYPPFAPAPPQTAPLAKALLQPGVFDLDGAMKNFGDQTGTDVTAFRWRGRLFIRICGRTLGAYGHRPLPRLERVFERVGKAKVSVSGSGATAFVELSPGDKEAAALALIGDLQTKPATS